MLRSLLLLSIPLAQCLASAFLIAPSPPTTSLLAIRSSPGAFMLSNRPIVNGRRQARPMGSMMMSPLDAIVGIPDYGALNEASELWVRSFVWLDFRLAGIVPFLVRVPIMESDSRNSGGSGILCRQSAGAARFQVCPPISPHPLKHARH